MPSELQLTVEAMNARVDLDAVNGQLEASTTELNQVKAERDALQQQVAVLSAPPPPVTP